MSRSLDDLSDSFKPKAIELIARCVEDGIPILIIFTGRTEAAQAKLYAQGRTEPGKIVTWTLESKHIMKPRTNHPDEAKSDAIDIAPWEIFQLHGPDKIQWDAGDPIWPKIGVIGQRLGLKWGVVKNGMQIDPGHFEDI